MRTLLLCELCGNLLGCINGHERLCVTCEFSCMLGKEEVKKKTFGICIYCLIELEKK